MEAFCAEPQPALYLVLPFGRYSFPGASGSAASLTGNTAKHCLEDTHLEAYVLFFISVELSMCILVINKLGTFRKITTSSLLLFTVAILIKIQILNYSPRQLYFELGSFDWTSQRYLLCMQLSVLVVLLVSHCGWDCLALSVGPDGDPISQRSQFGQIMSFWPLLAHDERIYLTAKTQIDLEQASLSSNYACI